MKAPPDLFDQNDSIAALLERIEVLVADHSASCGGVAELEAELGLPVPMATPVRFAD